MNKTQAIKKHCLECAGDSAKEVTLCHIIDCPLWEFRTGNTPRSNVYKKRLEKAKKRWPDDYREMEKVRQERMDEEKTAFLALHGPK
jgi:hypothetical protein